MVEPPKAISITALLIEDNPADADLIRELLEEAPAPQHDAPSFELVHADRLAPAEERLRRGDVGVVLLDLSLPDSQGIATLARVSRWAPDTPVVVLSGLDDEAMAMQAVREGAQDYLVKGRVDGAALSRALRYAVERKRSEEERARLVQQHAQERSRAERLQTRASQHSAIARLGQRALADGGLPELMSAAASTLAEVLAVEFVSVMELQPDRRTLRLRAGQGWPAPPGDFSVDSLATLAGLALDSAQPVVIEDMRAETRFAGQRLVDRFGILSGLAVVIQGVARPYGALAALTTRQRAFTSDDTDFVQSVANVLAMAIERAANERALREERERLALAQAAGHIGTFEWDLTSAAVTWSRELEALYGLPPGGFGGRFDDWVALIHPEDRERAVEEARLATAGAPYDTLFRVVWPDGSVHSLAAKGEVVRDADGRPARLLGVNVDVTERERALAETQEAVRIRDEVLSAVSHDLRTPLTAIKGHAQLLQQRVLRADLPDPERLIEGLNRIDKATTRMTSWIEELLDVARLEMGQQLRLNRMATDLVSLARDSVAEFQSTSPEHTIRLESELGRLVGSFDAPRIRRVLDNLISNAIKYSPDGGEVLVTVAREEDADAAGDWAILSVRDQGVGIPRSDQAHVFERFRRGRNVAGRIAGTGIGLAGASAIVREHGGRIELQSRQGRGSTFSLWLPLLHRTREEVDPARVDALSS